MSEFYGPKSKLIMVKATFPFFVLLFIQIQVLVMITLVWPTFNILNEILN